LGRLYDVGLDEHITYIDITKDQTYSEKVLGFDPWNVSDK